jgi:hypothetical protein
MNATITWVGGRAPPVRKRRRLAQDLVRPLQFADLAGLVLQQLALIDRQAWSQAGIALRLLDPTSKSLG